MALLTVSSIHAVAAYKAQARSIQAVDTQTLLHPEFPHEKDGIHSNDSDNHGQWSPDAPKDLPKVLMHCPHLTSG